MPIAATLHLGTAYGASIVTPTALTLTLTVTLILTCLKHSMDQGGQDKRVCRKRNGAQRRHCGVSIPKTRQDKHDRKMTFLAWPQWHGMADGTAKNMTGQTNIFKAKL